MVKEMESMYMEELRSSINLLKSNLESLPVSKGGTDSKYSLQKLKRYNRYIRKHLAGSVVVIMCCGFVVDVMSQLIHGFCVDEL